MIYTVVGVWEIGGDPESYVEFVEGDSPLDAAFNALTEDDDLLEAYIEGNFYVLSVFEGRHNDLFTSVMDEDLNKKANDANASAT